MHQLIGYCLTNNHGLYLIKALLVKILEIIFKRCSEFLGFSHVEQSTSGYYRSYTRVRFDSQSYGLLTIIEIN